MAKCKNKKKKVFTNPVIMENRIAPATSGTPGYCSGQQRT